MYGTQTSVLATTGFAGLTFFGMEFGVVQIMVAALLLMVMGVLAFRLATRRAKYVDASDDVS